MLCYCCIYIGFILRLKAETPIIHKSSGLEKCFTVGINNIQIPAPLKIRKVPSKHMPGLKPRELTVYMSTPGFTQEKKPSGVKMPLQGYNTGQSCGEIQCSWRER